MIVALIALTIVALAAIIGTVFIMREQAATLDRAYNARAREVKDLQDRLGRLIGQELLSTERIEELRKEQQADLDSSDSRRLHLTEDEIDRRLTDRNADGSDLPDKTMEGRITALFAGAMPAE